MPAEFTSSPAVDSSPPAVDSPAPTRPKPLWHIAVLVMLIVFGPAIAAWILTLIRVSH